MGLDNKQKMNNRNRILQYIYKNHDVTRPAIANALSLSLPTVQQNINDLIADKLVVETRKVGTGSGRKAKILEGVADTAYAFGINVTRNHIEFLCADLCANVRDYARNRMKFSNDPNYYREVGEKFAGFIEEQKIQADKICGVGISLPAFVTDDGNYTNGTRLLMQNNERIFLNYFKQYIPYPCNLFNDAKAALFAELYKPEEEEKNVVYLSLSSGVGGAFMTNGQLYRGNKNESSEFGHTIIVPNGRQCFCGAKGCAQMYLGSGILSRETDGNLEIFFQKLGSDPEIDAMWDSYLTSLSILVYNLRMIFDCKIILGGYVGSYIEKYLPQLIEKLRGITSYYNDFSYIQASRIKVAASAFGAALSYIDDFLDRA